MFYPRNRRALSAQMQPVAQPIFWVDGDNNNIDRISGRVASPIEYDHRYNLPLYVTDPRNPTRKCLQKRNGEFSVAVFLLDFSSGKGFNLTSNNQGTQNVHLDSFQGVGHRLEFMVYVNNNPSNRPFVTNGGLFSFDGYTQQAGIEIGIYNNNLVILSRNNSPTDNLRTIATLNSVVNQWLTIQYDVKEISSTTFSCIVKIFNELETIIATEQFLHSKPMINTRDTCYFFSDNMGWFSNAQNVYDYLKEVKIYRETDVSDFSIYS